MVQVWDQEEGQVPEGLVGRDQVKDPGRAGQVRDQHRADQVRDQDRADQEDLAVAFRYANWHLLKVAVSDGSTVEEARLTNSSDSKRRQASKLK